MKFSTGKPHELLMLSNALRLARGTLKLVPAIDRFDWQNRPVIDGTQNAEKHPDPGVFGKLSMSRTIVVGDIHGCFDELVSLLDMADLRAEDRVVAVGDLITKGPKSKEVLELFLTDNRFLSVLGNHDLALLRYWRGEGNSLKNSQAKAAKELEAEDRRYCEFLGSLPLMIDLGSHLVVHAGVRPGVPLEDQSAEDLTELRTLGEDRTSRKGVRWYEVYESEKTVLFGHWPNPEPIQTAHAIGLDTGCVYGHRLTAYVIDTKEFVSVPAIEAYDRPNKRISKAGSNSSA